MKKTLLVFMLSVLFSSFTYGQDFSIDKSENLNYIQGEVIVKYKDSSKTKRGTKSKGISVFDAELDNNNLDIKQKLNNNGDIFLVEINNGNSVEETIDLLKNDPNIEYVEPNFVRYLFSGETSYSITQKDQWALNAISWYDAFNTYSGDLKNAEPVVAGVIDNGVNYNHLDLVNSMRNPSSCSFYYSPLDCVHGFDFFHGKPTPLANSNSHGTHVAGIIAAEANNGIGITGINPYAKIAALKIGDSIQLSSFDELSAIYFAIENGIKLINASFGGPSYSDIEQLAIENFGNAGGLFIAAAGNESIDVDKNPVYPCSYDLDNIICVAATSDISGSFAFDYSNYGTGNVDVAAPGTSIISTVTSSTLKKYFEEDFNKDNGKCSTGWDVLDNWNLLGAGGCFPVSKKDDNDYGYIFVDEVKSPYFSGKVATDLSIYVNCVGGANLSFGYSTGDSNYTPFYLLEDIEGDGMYRISLFDTINDDISDNLSLSFKIINSSSDRACVIDDIIVYNDPYSSGSVSLYGNKDGTSMATPHVVGLASMVWMLNPDLTNFDVKRLILENGDYKSGLSTRVKDGKVINVKKTLDEAIKIASPSGLDSSWSGYIQWNNVSKAQSYYYEILSGNVIIDSGNTISTGLQTNLSGDYVWRIKSIASTSGCDSNFSTGYICSKPILTINNLLGNFSGYECTSLVGKFTFSDNCSDNYEMGRVGGTGLATLNNSGVVVKQIYIRNSFGEESILDIIYYFKDTIPTLTNSSYDYPSILSSSKNIGNVISSFGVVDGACGNSSISVSSISCAVGQGSVSSNNITITPPSNKNGSSSCSVKFKDDEGNEVSGTLTYSYNTVQSTTTNGGGGGGGGGGGDSYSCKNLPVNATANNKTAPKSDTNYSYSTDTSKVCTFQCNSGYTRDEKNDKCEKKQVVTGDVNTGDLLQNIEIEKTKQIELFGEADISSNSTSNIDFSWFNESNPSSILSNGFTVEFNNAYEFAHRVGITTIDSIEKANMNGELTRIAMAKMLSQYAINILGKNPDTSKNVVFGDVSKELDSQYNDGVTLAYQLGIMGVGINKFRPNDSVTRKEFGTALSRMLFGTADGKGVYYSTHLAKLKSEGIINNDNPDLTELRGYVMTMLMRSAKK